MKQSEKPIRLEDVELVPDALERLEGAIFRAYQQKRLRLPGAQTALPLVIMK